MHVEFCQSAAKGSGRGGERARAKPCPVDQQSRQHTTRANRAPLLLVTPNSLLSDPFFFSLLLYPFPPRSYSPSVPASPFSPLPWPCPLSLAQVRRLRSPLAPSEPTMSLSFVTPPSSPPPPLSTDDPSHAPSHDQTVEGHTLLSPSLSELDSPDPNGRPSPSLVLPVANDEEDITGLGSHCTSFSPSPLSLVSP